MSMKTTNTLGPYRTLVKHLTKKVRTLKRSLMLNERSYVCVEASGAPHRFEDALTDPEETEAELRKLLVWDEWTE